MFGVWLGSLEHAGLVGGGAVQLGEAMLLGLVCLGRNSLAGVFIYVVKKLRLRPEWLVEALHHSHLSGRYMYTSIEQYLIPDCKTHPKAAMIVSSDASATCDPCLWWHECLPMSC